MTTSITKMNKVLQQKIEEVLGIYSMPTTIKGVYR